MVPGTPGAPPQPTSRQREAERQEMPLKVTLPWPVGGALTWLQDVPFQCSTRPSGNEAPCDIACSDPPARQSFADGQARAVRLGRSLVMGAMGEMDHVDPCHTSLNGWDGLVRVDCSSPTAMQSSVLTQWMAFSQEAAVPAGFGIEDSDQDFP